MTSYVRFVAGQLNLCTYSGVFKYFFCYRCPPSGARLLRQAPSVCVCLIYRVRMSSSCVTRKPLELESPKLVHMLAWRHPDVADILVLEGQRTTKTGALGLPCISGCPCSDAVGWASGTR